MATFNSDGTKGRIGQTVCEGRKTTLLDLICSLRADCEDEIAIVDTVREQLQTGVVVLCGNFAGQTGWWNA